MRLTKVHIHQYRSIEDSGEFEIEPDVTCLVGKNESGKTAVLKALEKLSPQFESVEFEVTRDYPRRNMTQYERIHPKHPAVAIETLFELELDEVAEVEKFLAPGCLVQPQVKVSKNYANELLVELPVREDRIVEHLLAAGGLDPRAVEAGKTAHDLSQLETMLQGLEQTESVKALLARITSFEDNAGQAAWDQCLSAGFPMFMFFDDYSVMKGCAPLEALSKPPAQMADAGFCALKDLLDLAGTPPQSLVNAPNQYEAHKARLEATANRITDEVFAFWSQNKNLEVEFDVSSTGAQPNQQLLHVRIKNTRHRVTVPFDDRSRGFVWFFSFLARFDRIAEDGKPLIILLDEPALNLHASAQADFLRFIEERLAPNHQVIYTTHSPFMIAPTKLHRVRTVEDLEKRGTVVSKDVLVADHATSFPLQAALGYSMAQSLFIGPNCLLVEGASDLIYLQVLSDCLRRLGRVGLDPRWVITPVGGASRLTSFATLLGANKLNTVLFMDFSSADEQRIDRLLSESRLDQGRVVRVSEFVAGTRDADIEDLFDVATYLRLVRAAYPDAPALAEASVLPEGRLVKQIEKSLRLAGYSGFDHYGPARAAIKEFATEMPPPRVLETFERVALRINSLLRT